MQVRGFLSLTLRLVNGLWTQDMGLKRQAYFRMSPWQCFDCQIRLVQKQPGLPNSPNVELAMACMLHFNKLKTTSALKIIIESKGATTPVSFLGTPVTRICPTFVGICTLYKMCTQVCTPRRMQTTLWIKARHDCSLALFPGLTQKIYWSIFNFLPCIHV